MMKITRDYVLEQLRTALVKLWLLDSLGEIEGLISNKHEIGEQVSELAIRALQAIDKFDDKRLEGALISMCDLRLVGPAGLHERIVDILNGLSSSPLTITDQDKMNGLQMLIAPILEQIKAKQSLRDAVTYLVLLHRVSRLAAQLAFSGNADLNEAMDILIRDFEHGDEESVLQSVFNDIQNGAYLQTAAANSLVIPLSK